MWKKKFNDLVVKYVGPEIEKNMGLPLRAGAQGGAFGYYVTRSLTSAPFDFPG